MSKRLKLKHKPSTLVDGFCNINYLLSLEKTRIGSGEFGVVHKVTIESQDSATYAVALKIFKDPRKRLRIPFFNNMLEKTDASLWPCAVFGEDHPTKPYFAEGVCDGSNVVVCVMGIWPAVTQTNADTVTELAKLCFENNVYVLDFKRENFGWNGTHLCLLDIDAVLYPENIFLNIDDYLVYEMAAYGNMAACIRRQQVEYDHPSRYWISSNAKVAQFKKGEKVSLYQLLNDENPKKKDASKEKRLTIPHVPIIDDISEGCYINVTARRVRSFHVLRPSVHGDGQNNLNEATKTQLALITLFAMLGEAGGIFGPKLVKSTEGMAPGTVVTLMVARVKMFWAKYVSSEKLSWLYHTFMAQAAGQVVAESVKLLNEDSLLASFNDRAFASPSPASSRL